MSRNIARSVRESLRHRYVEEFTTNEAKNHHEVNGNDHEDDEMEQEEEILGEHSAASEDAVSDKASQANEEKDNNPMDNDEASKANEEEKDVRMGDTES